MLGDGTLAGYIDELSVTGLTSNPTIFDKAISGGDAYDEQIAELSASAVPTRGSARPRRSGSSSSWRSPTCATPTDLFARGPRAHRRRRRLLLARGLAADRRRHRGDHRAGRRSCTPRPSATTSSSRSPAPRRACRRSRSRSSPASRSTSPCSSTTEQYLAAADAYMKGIERRIEAGLDADVASVASIFMSRWDVAVADEVPDELNNRLGLAIGFQRLPRLPRAARLADRMQRLMNEGARPQRLLWASTGTKDPDASDTLYIEGFASPFTVNTMPEPTLHAFADHGEVGDPVPRRRRRLPTRCWREFASAGIDVDALAERLQEEGKEAFVKSWDELLETIESQVGGARVSDVAAPTAPSGAAWQALESHYAEIERPAPARPLRRGPRARRAAGRRRRRPPPRLLQEPDHRRDADPARRAGPRARGRGAPRSDVRRRAHQRLRGPRRAPRGAADAARALADRRRRRRGQGGARDARPDGAPSPSGSAPASGPATPASRSATSSTSASAAPTSAR